MHDGQLVGGARAEWQGRRGPDRPAAPCNRMAGMQHRLATQHSTLRVRPHGEVAPFHRSWLGLHHTASTGIVQVNRYRCTAVLDYSTMLIASTRPEVACRLHTTTATLHPSTPRVLHYYPTTTLLPSTHSNPAPHHLSGASISARVRCGRVRQPARRLAAPPALSRPSRTSAASS